VRLHPAIAPIVLIALAGLQSGGIASASPTTFRSAHGFRVTVPDGWTVGDAGAIGKDLGLPADLPLDAAYERLVPGEGGARSVLAIAYEVVTSWSTGFRSVAEVTFAHLKGVPGLRGVSSTIEKETATWVGELSDADGQRVVLRQFLRAGRTGVAALILLHPHRASSDMDAAWRSITGSCEFEEGHRYSQILVDLQPSNIGRKLLAAVILIVVVGALGALWRRATKRRPPKGPTGPRAVQRRRGSATG
jgi:hypothetical protein